MLMFHFSNSSNQLLWQVSSMTKSLCEQHLRGMFNVNNLTDLFRNLICKVSLPSVRFPLMLSRGYQRARPLEQYHMLQQTIFVP